jgi:hypothetical protein
MTKYITVPLMPTKEMIQAFYDLQECIRRMIRRRKKMWAERRKVTLEVAA